MLFKVWKQVAIGKTPLRSLMNISLSDYTLEPGVVVDLGGGNNPSYLGFLKGVKEATFKNIDMQHGEGDAKQIDFEKDPLPYESNSIDQVLMLNVLEHIYHHSFFAGEAHRILKPGKTVIGFVPFLINYHADPHDYFRYTHEALEKIFTEVGFKEVSIKPLGGGPFLLNFNTLASFLPRYITTVLWPFYYIVDRVLLSVKPTLAKRFPLGYLFVLTK
jgi:SAM-dependent methyltransferase